MKKFKLSIMTAIAITGIMATNATAATVGISNNNVALVTQIVKSKNIDKMVSRANALDGYAEQYILLTGHMPSNINDIKSKFALSNDSIANFSGAPLNIFVNANNYKVTIGYLFNSDIDSNTLSLLDNSSALAPTANINQNQSGGMYNPSITYPMSSNVINFITKIKAVSSNPNNYISVNAPGNTSKTWYKPTGDGNFYIYKFISGHWKNAGNLSASGIVVNSAGELNQYNSVAKTGTKAYVKEKDGNSFDTYIYTGTGWSKLSARNQYEKKLYTGKSSLPTCNADLSGIELFTVKDKTATGYVCNGSGQWIAAGGNDVVILPGIWGQQNFDDTPQFKGVVNTSTPFCDSAKPHHCFKNWNDFISKSDVYKALAIDSGEIRWTGWRKVNWNSAIAADFRNMSLMSNNLVNKYHFVFKAPIYTAAHFDYSNDYYDANIILGFCLNNNPMQLYNTHSYDPQWVDCYNNRTSGLGVWYKPKGSPAP